MVKKLVNRSKEWQLRLVIPATGKAEIEGSRFQANHGKKVSETLSQRNNSGWCYSPVIPATQEA
jgi:hypothetical protein